MHAFTHARLGETTESFALSGLDDLIQGAALLVSQAKRQVQIVLPEEDPGLYGTGLVLDTLSAFTRGSRYRRVHLLATSGLQWLQNNYALVDLSHRVGSSLEIRVCALDIRPLLRPMLLVDSYGLMLGPDARSTAVLRFNTPAEVEPLRGDFQRAWEQSGQSEELRRVFR